MKTNLSKTETILLKDRAQRIRSQAVQFEHQLKKIVDLSGKLGIQLSPEVINELTHSAPAGILDQVNAKQEAVNDSYALANLQKKPTKKLNEDCNMLNELRDEIRRLTNTKPFPGRIWQGAKIDEKALNALILIQCNVELTAQQQKDIELIEQIAKVKDRFNPMNFITGNKVDIESFLDLSTGFNN